MTDNHTSDAPATASESSSDEIPGLFSSSPHGILALLAAGTGCVAVGSVGLEVMTDRVLAQTVDMGVRYVSLPLGIATVILAGLTALERPKWAAPSVLLALLYFAVFAFV